LTPLAGAVLLLMELQPNNGLIEAEPNPPLMACIDTLIPELAGEAAARYRRALQAPATDLAALAPSPSSAAAEAGRLACDRDFAGGDRRTRVFVDDYLAAESSRSALRSLLIEAGVGPEALAALSAQPEPGILSAQFNSTDADLQRLRPQLDRLGIAVEHRRLALLYMQANRRAQLLGRMVRPPPQRARWISGRIEPDDYPARAMRDQVEGRTTVLLEVRPDGRVGNCAIFDSSGSVDLDDRACRLIQQRFRYQPARDTQGNATFDVIGFRYLWILSR
jgi:TonB family protein